ncbi:hypothetical protein PV326_003433 [Microctonus aethiopoides]|nr:hypothetical protein PV326_003433 [Microctonus aethiopoides]
MSSSDSGQGQSLCTPRRSVQKKLFGVTGCISKRNLFQINSSVRRDDGMSGEDSDLGPMSPLDITDNSSNESSPGRDYHSPFTTPEKSPRVLSLSWDRLRPSFSHSKSCGLSPFSSLKKLTRDARTSPRRKIFSNSPKSSFSSPNKNDLENFIPASPSQTELASYIDGIVPETPQKDSIADSPQKENYSERRLITPLGSVSKDIAVPPVHRRKSICPFDSSDDTSPERKENSMKRHATESLNTSGMKLIKIDEGSLIPRARASLFKEDKNNTPKLTPLSTKSFYSSSNEPKRHSFAFGWRSAEAVTKKRHSLPLNGHFRRSIGSSKRQKFGAINAGVRHGIKRPKIKKKRHSLATSAPSTKKSMAETNENPPPQESHANISLPVINPVVTPKPSPLPPRAPSPIEDPNKRFFKTNRTVKINREATVTVNGNIKLKVSDGKIALNQKKRSIRPVNKKPKLDNVEFDATDLTVDDPSFDASVNQNDVAGILKVLENDWADDEYDALEPLTTNQTNAKSPLKSARITSDALLSPASVLSTMTSSMNIEDKNSLKNVEINNSTDFNQESKGNDTKYFPLFAKGYTSNVPENLEEKKSRGVKRPASWQLSTKTNGGGDQYQLDAGQKVFGIVQCNECNVVYQVGEPEDENAHLVHHNSFRTLKYNGWKNERVVYQDPFTGNRIITIESTDPKLHWKKVEQVLAVVDKDMGLSCMKMPDYHGKKIYLYVEDKTIVGVLVAEPVKIAYRMIPEFFDLDCCSEESTPAKCGVNIIWTALTHRRKGIARKLMDVLRSNFYYGYIMTLDDIAFSIPSPGGKIFAEKYMGSRDFKVYSEETDQKPK